MQCPCIPFQYAGDGCYARAHYMRKLKAWKEYPIPEDAVVFTTNVRILQPGELGWFDTEETGIPIWFRGTTAYYLPRDIKYYQLLKGKPSEEYNIVKITLDVERVNSKTGGISVVKVELPSRVEKEIEEKRLKSSSEPLSSQIRSS